MKSKHKLLCHTRWVEQHTWIFDFCTMLWVTIYCLGIITQNDDNSRKWNRKSITEADGLLHIMCSSPFLVALKCTQFLFGFTCNVAKLLQSQAVDVIIAHTRIKLSLSSEIWEVIIKKYFDSIFTKAVEMANDCVTTIEIRRRCQQQTNKRNYEGQPEYFYHNTLFIPYLDNLILQFKSRFHRINLSAIRTLHLIPKNRFINKRISNIYPHLLWWKITKYWLLWIGSSIVKMLLEPVRGTTINSLQNSKKVYENTFPLSKYTWMKNFDLFSQCVIFTKNLCKGCWYK